MAATTLPLRKGSNRWITIGIVIIALAIIAAVGFNSFGQPQNVEIDTTPVTRGAITSTVSGSGTITADQSLDIAFQTGGVVTEVLVEVGDSVVAGQPLAILDARELELQVTQAEADLATAQAQLAQAREGNATDAEIAAAEASLANAEAQLDRTITNNVTEADIASAQAALRSAQAQLNDLLDGADPEDLVTSQARVEQAQADLEAQRTKLSIAKTNAESQLNQAANALRDAQDEYSRIYWDNREIEDSARDLTQAEIDQEAAALRTVQDGEESLLQAQTAYNQAVEDERTGLAKAEAELRDAEAQLAATERGATEAEIIQAQATVDQRQADLDKLLAGGTAADIAAAAATVDQQQASLEQLTASATETDLSIREASVAQAEQSLAQAELQLSYATLIAPFDGVVSAVDIVPGSVVASGAAVASLVDHDPLHVELLLSENDVATVALDQPVVIEIDAINDWQAEGVVSYIAPVAEDSSGVVTYDVYVSFPGTDNSARIGMTANIDIETAHKDDALLVPSTALLPQGSDQIVQVHEGDQVREVVVETGLSDGQFTEIISGLDEDDVVVTLPTSDISAPSQQVPFGG